MSAEYHYVVPMFFYYKKVAKKEGKILKGKRIRKVFILPFCKCDSFPFKSWHTDEDKKGIDTWKPNWSIYTLNPRYGSATLEFVWSADHKNLGIEKA